MAREMKDSGIPWIGEIPADWTLSKVSRFYRIQLGKMLQPVKKTDDNSFERYLCAANVGQNRLKIDDIKKMWFTPQEKEIYEICQGDLLVVEGGDVASSDIVSTELGEIYFQNSLHRVRPISGFDVRFLRFWLIAAKACGHIDLICNKATIAHFSKEKFASLLFPAITIKEQIRIADTLDRKCAEIDAVLEKTRTSIEGYKKLKQAVITQAVTKGIQGDRPMRKSGSQWFGLIPANWEMHKTKKLFAIEKRIIGAEGATVLSITQNGIRPKDLSKNEGQLAGSYSNYQIVHPGDFAMNHMDLLTGWVDVSKYEGVTSPDYRVFTLRDCAAACKRYYLYLFQMCYFNRIYYGLGQGVSGFGRWRLPANQFLNFLIPVPPREEQNEIAEYLDDHCTKIDTLIQKKEQFLTELETYKKSLIYEYVTGKKEASPEQERQIREFTVYPYFPAAIQVKRPRFAQAVLMSKVLDECRTKIGRVKLEKIMFVLENSIGFDFDTKYVREAAGPLDQSIYTCEGIISRSTKWYIITSSRYGVSYKPAKDQPKYKNYYEKYFGEYDVEIKRVIDIFKDYSTDQAEIIATLYGAWNDFVIDKRDYTDDDIVDEVLNNWNDSKKRFPRDVWLRAIDEMRKLEIVPHGYGRRTVNK